jgi:hypothetical protein
MDSRWPSGEEPVPNRFGTSTGRGCRLLRHQVPVDLRRRHDVPVDRRARAVSKTVSDAGSGVARRAAL